MDARLGDDRRAAVKTLGTRGGPMDTAGIGSRRKGRVALFIASPENRDSARTSTAHLDGSPIGERPLRAASVGSIARIAPERK